MRSMGEAIGGVKSQDDGIGDTVKKNSAEEVQEMQTGTSVPQSQEKQCIF